MATCVNGDVDALTLSGHSAMSRAATGDGSCRVPRYAVAAIPDAASTHAIASRARARCEAAAATGATVACAGSVAAAGTGRAPDSASENSRAVAHRSAGNFSSAFSTVASTCTGTLARLARMLRGFSVSTRAMIACDVLPVCGGSPVSISYVTAPSE
jgi:hypothetical protein